MTDTPQDTVSRRRYQREQAARAEAEQLLELKSRELYQANQELSQHSAALEQAVLERTAELQLALERAEAASTARSRFVATMSHEIRTPLGGMLGMIDLLGMDETDPAKKELLDYAKSAGVGLSRIVNDVLDFSKMEAGLFVFEEEHVDIRALIESVRKLSVPSNDGVQRKIRSKISDSVPKLFLGDATRMRQVLANLVSNALRYSDDGPIIIRVTAEPHPKDAILRVEVEDFGVGIPKSETGNLFKDFSQVSNSLSAAAQGTGLGLAICKRILEGCGGQIGVDSTFGEGSSFWFELPVEVVAGPALIKGETTADIVLATLTGKRVLIAEDNIINQKLLLTYANRMGLITELAENGRIAVEKFAPEKFDVVLMDVAMPEMDGLEAMRCIQEKWGTDVLPPILVLTAHVMDAIEDEARLVGVETVLSKPIPFEDLKFALETALSKVSEQRNSITPVAPEKKGTFFDHMSPAVTKEMLEMFSVEDLSDLAAKFIADSTERLAKIFAAIENGDGKTIAAEAHSLKGSSLVFGLNGLPEWTATIEKSQLGPDTDLIVKNAVLIRGRLEELGDLLKT